MIQHCRAIAKKFGQVCLLVLLAACGTPAGAGVEVRQIPLSAVTGDQTVGRLVWRGGLVISGARGLSDLTVSADGRDLLALSDIARWLTGTLHYDAQGNLAGLSAVRRGRAVDRAGRSLRARRLRDAEGLARLGNGDLVVSFEHAHRLWRYAPSTPPFARPPTPLTLPDALARAPENGGIEAVAALDGDRLVLLAEDMASADGRHWLAWLGDGHQWAPMLLTRHGGFQPTGAARLPDGDLVVLERHFSGLGFAAHLRRVAAGEIRPGAVLDGRELARLAAPLEVDNFEGIAVRQGPRGETLIYLLSDDNFSFLQRTLLMMFELR